MENLFYKTLVLLGLRKKPYANTNNVFSPKLKNIFRRNIISFKNSDTFEKIDKVKQSRKITRELFKKLYNRDLSPEISRSISENIQYPNEDRIILNVTVPQRHTTLVDKLYNVYDLICIWIYPFTIFSILCVSPINTSIFLFNRCSNDSLNLYLSNLFFQLIPPTQYLLLFKYYSSDHFEKFYFNNEKLNACLPSIDKLTLISYIITAIIIIINFLILKSNTPFGQVDRDFSNYDNYSRTSKIFIDIIMFLSWFYGTMIILININIFSLVFCKHCEILKTYVKKLKNDKHNIMTINKISQDSIKIKYDLELSIDEFKNIFSSYTLLGAIQYAFFFEKIKKGDLSEFPIITFVIYVIVQIIFIIVIYRISKHKENLAKLIKRPSMINKFIKRYSIKEVKTKFQDCNETIVFTNMIEENASNIDWIILNDILNSNWTTFEVLGIDVTDFGLIKKGILLVTLFVAFNSYISN